ncbi:hypothetical protein [Olivibacter jilunii]|uniref:hypothetical protein n=1 Tax=Olivibacter jilunii TaxID=985016 RepID=UPI001031CD40|nr:hypothetical protein [Olivibacter jilunii]
MATEAGKGENKVYVKIPESNDKAKLTVRNHYIGVDAVAWYVNKENNWFSNKMASGTLEIKLSSGLENYSVALGTFEFKGGSKIAPIFEQAVIPDRNFRGGNITLRAQLSAVKKDTALAGILKSAAKATLGVAAGMVSTASAVTGPSKFVAAAGEDIISGVKNVLSATGAKREPLFDFSGLEYSIRPEDIVGPEVYILFHRGKVLNTNQLQIKKEENIYLPFYNNVLLDDGVWLLVRIRRSDEYTGVREWHELARQFRTKISNKVNDFFFGLADKSKALSEFQPTASGEATLMDEYIKLRSLINYDGVITEREANFHVMYLLTIVHAAKVAISNDKKELYEAEIEKFNNAVLSSIVPETRLLTSYKEEINNLLSLRAGTISSDTPFKRVASMSLNDVFSSTKYMKNLVSEYNDQRVMG